MLSSGPSVVGAACVVAVVAVPSVVGTPAVDCPCLAVVSVFAVVSGTGLIVGRGYALYSSGIVVSLSSVKRRLDHISVVDKTVVV